MAPLFVLDRGWLVEIASTFARHLQRLDTLAPSAMFRRAALLSAKLRPISNLVMIQKDTPAAETKVHRLSLVLPASPALLLTGGFIMPESALKANEATVLAVGPEAKEELKAGDK
eukprot:gene5741-5675_t